MINNKRTLLLTSVEHILFMIRNGGLPEGLEAIVLTPGGRRSISKILKQKGVRLDVPYWGVEDLTKIGEPLGLETFPEPPILNAEPILNKCLLFFLLDRNTKWRIRSNFLNANRMNVIIQNSNRLLVGLGITRIISCSTPHELLTYLFARVAEELKIKTMILDKTPLLHRYWALSSLDNVPPTALIPQINSGVGISARTQECVGKLRSDISADSEIGLKAQKSIYGRSSMSLMGELRRDGLSLFRYPWRVVSIINKLRLFRLYSELTKPLPPSKVKIISFFLHYQPERTTLPEGRIFVMQQLAIQILSEAIPNDWHICVREHPSTWLRRLPLTCRDSYFYRSIAAIPKVQFVSNEIPTNELVDRSTIVSTITGKVGFQALARGRIAIVFGTAGYRDHPGCVYASTHEDVRRAVILADETISSGTKGNIVMNNYLSAVESVSIEESSLKIPHTSYEIRLASMQSLINMILSHNKF